MNKGELFDEVYEKVRSSDIAKKDVELVINTFMDVVKEAVAKDDKVSLPGFGGWTRTDRKAREGRNPRTGETVAIPASKGVKFTVGAAFKSAVQ